MKQPNGRRRWLPKLYALGILTEVAYAMAILGVVAVASYVFAWWWAR